jgi:lysozyme
MKVNRGEWDAAAEAFMSWTKAGGKEVAGLVKRRKAEVALFLS